MSFLLLMIAFVMTGFVAIANKALIAYHLDAYRDLYMLAFYATPIPLGAALVLVTRQKSNHMDWKVGLMMGFAGALSMVFFIMALAHLPAIVVFPVRNLGNIVLTGLVSLAAFKEKLSRSQWLGIVLSLIAIWLICQER